MADEKKAEKPAAAEKTETAAAVAQQKQEAGASAKADTAAKQTGEKQASSKTGSQQQASAAPKLNNISGSSDKTNKTWLEHKSSPEVDRELAFKKIREYAAKHGGLCTGLTGQDGKPLIDPATKKPYTAEALIENIKYTNANKVDASGKVVEGGMRCAVRGPGIGPNGSNVFEFVETPNKTTLQKPKEQVKKKEEEKEKGGFWNWCKRNWGYLLGGAALLGVGAGFLFRKKKKSSAATVEKKDATQSAPTAKAPEKSDNSVNAGIAPGNIKIDSPKYSTDVGLANTKIDSPKYSTDVGLPGKLQRVADAVITQEQPDNELGPNLAYGGNEMGRG